MQEDPGPRRSRAGPGLRPRGLGVAVLALALAGAAIARGFYTLFSTFRHYDDEGYMLMAVRLFFDGHVLYDELFTPYGPIYFLYKGILHGPLGVPLSNDAVRFVALGHWALIATACGLAVLRASASGVWAAVGAGAVFFYLDALRNEPGHTQELTAVLAAALPLVAWRERGATGPGLWLAAGAVAGLALLSKPNAGLFCLVAAAAVLLAGAPAARGVALLRALLLVVSVAAPFALMRPLLHTTSYASFAVLGSAAATAAALAVLRAPPVAPPLRRGAVALLAGLGASAVAGFGFAAAHGSTPGAWIASVLRFSAAAQQMYKDVPLEPAQALVACAAPLAAWLLTRSAARRAAPAPIGTGREPELALRAAQLAFACAALVAALSGNEAAVLGWAGPWCWLCAVRGASERFATGRGLLAVSAAWHLLLAYPVPGSQIQLGSFLVLAAALVCGADALGPVAARLARGRVSAARASAGAGVAVGLVVLGCLVSGARAERQRYRAGESLALPGARRVHLPQERARAYRELVAAAAEADVVFATTGMNSLYLWTGRAMPAPVLLGHDPSLLPRAEREALVEGLSRAREPLVIYEPPLQGMLPRIELARWIDRHFEAYRRVGRYVLLRRRPSPGRE